MVIAREHLERHQVWCYAVAIVIGLVMGTAAPTFGRLFEALLWPSLGLLLYATFAQIPLRHLPDAFRDGRFITTVLICNFVVVPIVVAGLIQLTR